MSTVTRVILLPGNKLRRILIELVPNATKFLPMVTLGEGTRQQFMRILVNLSVMNVKAGLLTVQTWITIKELTIVNLLMKKSVLNVIKCSKAKSH